MLVLNIEGIPESCSKCRFYKHGYCLIMYKYISSYPSKSPDCPILGEIPAVMTYTLPDNVDVDSFMKGVDWVFSYIEGEE